MAVTEMTKIRGTRVASAVTEVSTKNFKKHLKQNDSSLFIW